MNVRVLSVFAVLLLTGPAFAQSKGQLQLPDFTALTEKASESVTVQFDANLLAIASDWLNTNDPAQAKAKKLAKSLTGIYVRHFTFDADYAYPKGDIDRVRRQLSAPGWSQIVGARSKKENTDVNVFVLINGGKAEGLAIIASEPREFTIVNIVGSIDLAQLHELEGSFGVPELGIETDRKPAPAKPN
jgi:hypothetical protein